MAEVRYLRNSETRMNTGYLRDKKCTTPHMAWNNCGAQTQSTNGIIRQLKAYAKAMNFDKSYDPYKAAYGRMPSSASANPEIKQLYINGHFCYVYKFGIVTNGLGIVRHIAFYNKDWLATHPEIIVEKKSNSPDEDKSVGDARLLVPTLKDFFDAHPLILPI